MRHITISCLVLFISIGQQLSGQTLVPHPIPCIDVTPASIGALPSGVQATDCIEADGIDVNFNANQNYSIRAGEYIAFGANTIIEPNAAYQFHAFIDNGGLDLAWYEPNLSPGTVGLYDKLELGIQFNDSVNNQIDNFIDQTSGSKLNPFDPKDVDLYAEFYALIGGSWVGPKKVNGFYFQDFDRQLEEWDTLATEHNVVFPLIIKDL